MPAVDGGSDESRPLFPRTLELVEGLSQIWNASARPLQIVEWMAILVFVIGPLLKLASFLNLPISGSSDSDSGAAGTSPGSPNHNRDVEVAPV